MKKMVGGQEKKTAWGRIGGRSGKLTPLILPSFFRTTLAVAEVQPPSFLAISAIEIPYSRLKIHEHRSPARGRPGCGCRFLYPDLLKERQSLSGPGYPERSACLRFLESSNGAGFQERLIWLDEAWLSSTKKPLKGKVHVFHYVPFPNTGHRPYSFPKFFKSCSYP